MSEGEGPLEVYIVDDDPAIQTTIRLMLSRAEIKSRAFQSAIQFLDCAAELPSGCVLLDIRLPEMDGLEVLDRLKLQGILLPVVIVTGFADVPQAVLAMRKGAVNFIEKPFRRVQLLEAIEEAFVIGRRQSADNLQRKKYVALEKLTQREREILNFLARGLQSKMVAFELGISIRTVEMHRANIIEKLKAGNIAQALLLAREGGILDDL